MKRIYDVSIEFSQDLPVYEGDPAVYIEERSEMTKGDACNVSLLSFGSHTGTHIDVPKHFVDEGKSIDQLPLTYFMGKAKVFELMGKQQITAEDLRQLPISQGDIVVLKTDNTQRGLMKKEQFARDFVSVSGDGAAYLVEKGVKGVGVDYLSVEEFGSAEHATHRTLLGNEVLIIEGMVLESVPTGEYYLMALPLKLKNGNGCPVRAILIEE